MFVLLLEWKLSVIASWTFLRFQWTSNIAPSTQRVVSREMPYRSKNMSDKILIGNNFHRTNFLSDKITVGQKYCWTKFPSDEITVVQNSRQTKFPPDKCICWRTFVVRVSFVNWLVILMYDTRENLANVKFAAPRFKSINP